MWFAHACAHLCTATLHPAPSRYGGKTPVTPIGAVLVQRIRARAASDGRHSGHNDLAWLAKNEAQLLSGRLTPLALDGPLIEVDTTPDSLNDDALLQRLRSAVV